MAKIVLVAGQKGGSGKTHLSHLLAHGCGSLSRPIASAVIVTDPGRPIPPGGDGSRRYAIFDGRPVERLPFVLDALRVTERLLIVLDGAARQPELDEQMARQVADLTILPFKSSEDDVECVLSDLTRIPGSVAVPTQWPTHPGTRRDYQHFLSRIPPDRRLDPVPHLPRLPVLLGERYDTVQSSLSRPGQSFAIEVLHRMGVHPLDLAMPR